MPGNDSYTKILLHCDGNHGSQNFIDDAMGADYTWTTTGSSAHITTATFKFATGSGKFAIHNNVEYRISSLSGNLSFGSNNFTIDFWMRTTAMDVRLFYFYNDQDRYMEINLYSGNFKVWSYTTTQYQYISFSRYVYNITQDDEWHHFALVRNGTQLGLFVDGTLIGGWSDIGSYGIPDFPYKEIGKPYMPF